MSKNLPETNDTDFVNGEPIVEIENPEESFDREFVESPPFSTAAETKIRAEKDEMNDSPTNVRPPFGAEIEAPAAESPFAAANDESIPESPGNFTGAKNPDVPPEPKRNYSPETTNSFIYNDYQSETADETVRKSGLAYSAAMVLFASIVFMLLIGWFADLLLGSSPWGIVGGIALGSIIGFTQFFRITSQIINNKD